MLRYTLLLLSFLITSFLSYTQTIESLHTNEDVLAFVRKHNDRGSDYFINAPKPVFGEDTWKKQAKQLKAVTYEKADFDHNGLTDLLFNGFEDFDDSNVECRKVVVVVLSFDKDSFQFKLLPMNYGQAIPTAKVIAIGGKPHIQLLNKRYFYDETLKKSKTVEKTDTLLYAYNNFVELSRPAKHDIEKVNFRLTCGIGVHNNFTLTIKPDSAILVAEAYPNGEIFDLGGNFVTNLSPTVWADITNLLQYIRFTELEDQYICHCYDAGNMTLSISYDGGNVKEISDQGGRGTYGLETLNELLYQLKYTQPWKRPNLKSLKIDNLHDDEQVLSFVKLLDSTYTNLTIAKPIPTFIYADFIDSLSGFREKPWQEADFDNNGLTDLLFNGFIMRDTLNDYYDQVCIVIMDMGNGDFRVKQIDRYKVPDYFAARAIVINNKTYLSTYIWVRRNNEEKGIREMKYETDTLTYAFDAFVELSKPASYPIEKITYYVSGGFPYGQERSLTMSEDSAFLILGPKLGVYDSTPSFIGEASMDTAMWSGIKSLLQYIDCSSLKEHYAAPWTDDATAHLTIEYDGGKVKEIFDYGRKGTYALERLYTLFNDLQKKLAWKKFNPN